MLKVSSKGRYAVKAVYELARHYGLGHLTVAHIAESQNIPEQYLEQLMPLLRRAGVVNGMRGAQGGYQLACPPDRISVRDVVAAVEGPIVVAECTSESSAGCIEMDWCIGPDVWTRVQSAIDEAMTRITMDQLVAEQRIVSRESRLQPEVSKLLGGQGG